MNPGWSYILTAIGVFGLWLAGRKDWRGWLVGLSAQGVWLAYEATKIGREWKDRNDRLSSLNDEGSEEGFKFTFDGKTYLDNDTWSKAERAPAGRVASGGHHEHAEDARPSLPRRAGEGAGCVDERRRRRGRGRGGRRR